MKDNPNILAIETSTSACSVALQVETTVFDRFEIENNAHSKLLLSMVNEVLQDADLNRADLDVVAVGQGPGSFTGLRIGVGVAQGIAYGVGCPMLGLSSLQALAVQSDVANGYVLAGIDARMKEIYWALFEIDNKKSRLIGELNVTPPQSIDERQLGLITDDLHLGQVCLVGNAWSVYREDLDSSLLNRGGHLSDCVYPRANDILCLAQGAYKQENFVSAIEFVPEYVRNNVAAKKSV